MTPFTFKIDVYADLICPWCYIGKEALDRAMAIYTAQHPEVDFMLTWKPYILWPNAGASAYNRGAAFRRVFGTRAPTLLRRLDLLGAQYGITFRWDGKTGNPRDAHKLVLLAMEKDEAEAEGKTAVSSLSSPPLGTQETPHPEQRRPSSNPLTPSRPPAHHQTHLYATVSYIFRAAFQLGADPSSRDFLAQAAVELGLCASEDDAMAYLSEEDSEDDEFYEENTTDVMNIDVKTQAVIEEEEHNHHHHGHDHQPNQPTIATNRNFPPTTNQHQNQTHTPEKQTTPHTTNQNQNPTTTTTTKQKKQIRRTSIIDTATSRARALGVAAVPSYIVQGRWQVGGMQREEVWMGVFQRVRAAFAAEAETEAGVGLGDDVGVGKGLRVEREVERGW
ncbi:uncharacterized protein C8A04DRAFT_24758 [Dichotomopilus funicola]|uniref:DSBA-like thioredoxin domain-containing protein n=1 Tax=Dichotomopilus funicola TaxID=1934379 RepID=A0AAN6VA29_9PEZI|nr:hypothetical protein C8A04DRAFT_24758 [Dichotomopilus funicola]